MRHQQAIQVRPPLIRRRKRRAVEVKLGSHPSAVRWPRTPGIFSTNEGLVPCSPGCHEQQKHDESMGSTCCLPQSVILNSSQGSDGALIKEPNAPKEALSNSWRHQKENNKRTQVTDGGPHISMLLYRRGKSPASRLQLPRMQNDQPKLSISSTSQ